MANHPNHPSITFKPAIAVYDGDQTYDRLEFYKLPQAFYNLQVYGFPIAKSILISRFVIWNKGNWGVNYSDKIFNFLKQYNFSPYSSILAGNVRGDLWYSFSQSLNQIPMNMFHQNDTSVPFNSRWQYNPNLQLLPNISVLGNFINPFSFNGSYDYSLPIIIASMQSGTYILNYHYMTLDSSIDVVFVSRDQVRIEFETATDWDIGTFIQNRLENRTYAICSLVINKVEGNNLVEIGKSSLGITADFLFYEDLDTKLSQLQTDLDTYWTYRATKSQIFQAPFFITESYYIAEENKLLPPQSRVEKISRTVTYTASLTTIPNSFLTDDEIESYGNSTPTQYDIALYPDYFRNHCYLQRANNNYWNNEISNLPDLGITPAIKDESYTFLDLDFRNEYPIPNDNWNVSRPNDRYSASNYWLRNLFPDSVYDEYTHVYQTQQTGWDIFINFANMPPYPYDTFYTYDLNDFLPIRTAYKDFLISNLTSSYLINGINEVFDNKRFDVCNTQIYRLWLNPVERSEIGSGNDDLGFLMHYEAFTDPQSSGGNNYNSTIIPNIGYIQSNYFMIDEWTKYIEFKYAIPERERKVFKYLDSDAKSGILQDIYGYHGISEGLIYFGYKTTLPAPSVPTFQIYKFFERKRDAQGELPPAGSNLYSAGYYDNNDNWNEATLIITTNTDTIVSEIYAKPEVWTVQDYNNAYNVNTVDVATFINWWLTNVMVDSIKIQEIWACLGAGEASFLDNQQPVKMNLARKVDLTCKFLGINVNLDGTVNTVQATRYFNEGENLPIGWYPYQVGITAGWNEHLRVPNIIDLETMSIDDQQIGILYDVVSNKLEENASTGEKRIINGGYVACNSLPQYLRTMNDDFDKMLGGQFLGAGFITRGSTTYTYEGLANLLQEVFAKEHKIESDVAEIHLAVGVIQQLAKELIRGLGLPVANKTFPYEVQSSDTQAEDKDTLSSQVSEANIHYPGYAEGTPTLTDFLFDIFTQLGINNATNLTLKKKQLNNIDEEINK